MKKHARENADFDIDEKIQTINARLDKKLLGRDKEVVVKFDVERQLGSLPVEMAKFKSVGTKIYENHAKTILSAFFADLPLKKCVFDSRVGNYDFNITFEIQPR